MNEEKWIKNDWSTNIKFVKYFSISMLIVGIFLFIFFIYSISTIMNNEGFGWKIILFLGVFVPIFISIISLIIFYHMILLKYNIITKIKVYEDHLDFITVKNWRGRVNYKDIGVIMDIKVEKPVFSDTKRDVKTRGIFFYDQKRKRKSCLNLTTTPFYEFLPVYKEWVKNTGNKEALTITDIRLSEIAWSDYKKGKLDKLKERMEKNRYESWE